MFDIMLLSDYPFPGYKLVRIATHLVTLHNHQSCRFLKLVRVYIAIHDNTWQAYITYTSGLRSGAIKGNSNIWYNKRETQPISWNHSMTVVY